MKRVSLLLLAMLASPLVAADDKVCWVTFDYGGQKTGGPGGMGSSMSGTNDAFVYRRCQSQCYEDLPDYANIRGVKSCTIDGIDIEASKYKEIYLNNKANICLVQVVGKYAHNLYLSETDQECRANMSNYIMCNIQGNKCTYSLGRY